MGSTPIILNIMSKRNTYRSTIERQNGQHTKKYRPPHRGRRSRAVCCTRWVSVDSKIEKPIVRPSTSVVESERTLAELIELGHVRIAVGVQIDCTARTPTVNQ